MREAQKTYNPNTDLHGPESGTEDLGLRLYLSISLEITERIQVREKESCIP